MRGRRRDDGILNLNDSLLIEVNHFEMSVVYSVVDEALGATDGSSGCSAVADQLLGHGIEVQQTIRLT